MNKLKKHYTNILTLFIAFPFVILSLGYSEINRKVSAQESHEKNPPKRKTLRQIAQERDIDVSTGREREAEYSLEELSTSEAIIQGRIINTETTLTDDFIYTTYTIETQRVVKPFTSGVPLDCYQLANKAVPEPINSEFKITRPGGSMVVNGHRINATRADEHQLNQNESYIFFLSWSGDFKTYTLVGGISSVVLVHDDLRIIPLATSKDVKQSNEAFLKKNRSFGDFLESLKKIN
jgi:hypothetical protein